MVSLKLFGMPRIKPDHEKCVFFLYKEGQGVPSGTGFFVKKVTETSIHKYAITNHHVSNKDRGCGARSIRVNTIDGKSRYINTEEYQWAFCPEDDIAAADVTDVVLEGDDVACISENDFLNTSFAKRAEVAIGDDVFLTGLYEPHSHDSGRNVVSGRFGNLSIIVSETANVSYEALRVKYSGPRYVADMRSRSGYSGSPVFIYRMLSDLRDFDNNGSFGLDMGEITNDKDVPPISFIRLLGMHCAQFNDDVMVSYDSKHLANEKLSIQGAMTIIIPAWCISSLLDSKDLEYLRNERERNEPCSNAVGGMAT